jgi:hypothetical protein
MFQNPRNEECGEGRARYVVVAAIHRTLFLRRQCCKYCILLENNSGTIPTLLPFLFKYRMSQSTAGMSPIHHSNHVAQRSMVPWAASYVPLTSEQECREQRKPQTHNTSTMEPRQGELPTTKPQITKLEQVQKRKFAKKVFATKLRASELGRLEQDNDNVSENLSHYLSTYYPLTPVFNGVKRPSSGSIGRSPV